jgi:catechol 2,3-dioxygenase-like lactoylglutathione lyase family enzyme
MSSASTADVVTGVDFVSIPTRDLDRSVAFYGQTLGLERPAYRPDRNHAEFETGTVTLNVLDPERMGIGSFTPNANVIALHVDDIEAARATSSAA